jgi:hypothetical protein
MTVSAEGLYLFAVGRGLDSPVLAGVAGIDGAALQVVDHEDLQAVVCAVDLDEFGESSLARNLEDLAWLERVARTHNDVVSAVAESGTVAPMRLVTICAGEKSVRDRIEALYGDLSAALDRVEGRREWSVKVYAATPADEPPPEQADAAADVGSGAAYLRRKRAAADRRRAASDRSLHVADEIYAELAAGAMAARQLPPQDPRLTGRAEPMILNAAYLIAIDEGDAFRALVQRVGEGHRGATVEAEGPWPPYSFATLDAP